MKTLPMSKSPLAILRSILGENGVLERFAALIGKSKSWVLHASGAQIPITREAAYQIAIATGVDPEWLLAGSTQTQPKSINSNKVYTLESFHLHRSQTKSMLPAFIDPLTEAALEKIPEQLLKIVNAIYSVGQDQRKLPSILSALEEFADRIAYSDQYPIPPDFPQKPDSRKAAFARIALRSAMAQIKHSSKKSSAQNPANGAEC